jgi:hypothetical protein
VKQLEQGEGMGLLQELDDVADDTYEGHGSPTLCARAAAAIRELMSRAAIQGSSAAVQSEKGAPVAAPGELESDFGAYIAGLRWSPQATDHEKNLVVDNLRSLFAVLCEKHNAFVRAARVLGSAFAKADAALEHLSAEPPDVIGGAGDPGPPPPPQVAELSNAAPQVPDSVSTGADGEGAVSQRMTGEPLSPHSPIATPAAAACKGMYTDASHDHWECECGASWWNKCPLKNAAPQGESASGAVPAAAAPSTDKVSKTPRTDALASKYQDQWPWGKEACTLMYEHACQLERELAGVRHDLERALANHSADLAPSATLPKDVEDALRAALGALVEVSPCAYVECKQIQRDIVDWAEKKVRDILELYVGMPKP